MDPFRSPLLRTSRLISLPPGTEMFQFPGFASLLPVMTALADSRVAPFGHLGITACVPLPRASRSLPRPSSPLCAQASPTCLPSLDHNRCIQAELRALFQRVTFSCENVISIKDSINPTIYHVHPLSNSNDPHFSEENGVNNREWVDRMCRSEATTRCFPLRCGRLLAIR